MAKAVYTKAIRQIGVNKRDSSQNLIVNVLARANEYAIYEIDTPEPENRLRVQIDGHTNESEAKLIDRFNKVKQNYVLAKGLLYRSTNFNLMKNRVAHALATTLSSDDDNPNKIFQDLIDEIRNEYKEIIIRRLIFISPGYIMLTLLTINFLLNIYIPNYIGSEVVTQLLKFLSAAVIGGVLSMTYSVKKIIFETEPPRYFYFLSGCERISIAILAGIVVFDSMKTRMIFGELITSNHYASLFMGFVAGFFESFVPSLMKKHGKV